MKSPFPGMDPYLELNWRDVHHRLCTYACDFIQPQVRPQLLARVDERLVVEREEHTDRSVYPDVKLTTDPRHLGTFESGGVAVMDVVDEPLIIHVPSEETHEGFINIIDPKAGGKLVTVIEFLSPSNKTPGPGRDDYRRKQLELYEAGVSLVEVDLVRAGEWTVGASLSAVPRTHRTPYCVCVRRAWQNHRIEFYRVAFNERLPTVGVPLRKNDKDATLNLQSIIEKVYTNGAYDSTDYAVPLRPPLDRTTQQWANKLLRAAGQIKRKRAK